MRLTVGSSSGGIDACFFQFTASDEADQELETVEPPFQLFQFTASDEADPYITL